MIRERVDKENKDTHAQPLQREDSKGRLRQSDRERGPSSRAHARSNGNGSGSGSGSHGSPLISPSDLSPKGSTSASQAPDIKVNGNSGANTNEREKEQTHTEKATIVTSDGRKIAYEVVAFIILHLALMLKLSINCALFLCSCRRTMLVT